MYIHIQYIQMHIYIYINICVCYILHNDWTTLLENQISTHFNTTCACSLVHTTCACSLGLSLLFVDPVAVAHCVTRSCRMPQTVAIFFRSWKGWGLSCLCWQLQYCPKPLFFFFFNGLIPPSVLGEILLTSQFFCGRGDDPRLPAMVTTQTRHGIKTRVPRYPLVQSGQ